MFSERLSMDSNSIKKVHNMIYDWENISPLGLNKLRQEITGFRKGGVNLSPAEARYNRYIDSLSENIGSYVAEKVPQIGKLNAEYSQASKAIKEIVDELNLNSKDSTIITKLLTGYNKSDTFRSDLLGQLNKKGVSDLSQKISGFRANKVVPESAYSKIIGGGFAGASLFNPAVLASLPAFSPRVIGEVTNALGKTSGKLKKGLDTAKTTKVGSVVKYLGGQVYDKTKATRSATLIERMKEEREKRQSQKNQ